MKYITYILLSKLKDKTYVGYTSNLENSLWEHNRGESSFTKKFKPWVLIHKELFETREESVLRERYLKSAAGRRWMKKNLFGK